MTRLEPEHLVYGAIPHDLVTVATDAVQVSPRSPGARTLAELPEGSAASVVMHAPAHAIERRRELALALRALRPEGALTVVAANTKGGNRLLDDLTALGCEATGRPKHHHQIVTGLRPARELHLDASIAAGAPRLLPELGLWSQPGVFSWDHIDPGSRLLLAHLPPLAGRGADLGCGIGILARAVRASPQQPALVLVDIDARALDMARRNVPGDDVAFIWADLRMPEPRLPGGLDFVVMNPPFHDGGTEDKALGQVFIARAATMLRTGGVLWLTANRHLPYEATLAAQFGKVERVAEADGYKIYMAQKAAEATRTPRRPAR